MSDITRLKGIRNDEAQRLKTAGIDTITALWEHAGKDFKTGIDDIAGQAQIPRARLVELLANQGVVEYERGDKPWLLRYWLESLIIVGVLVLLGGVLRSRAAGHLAWLQPPLGRTAPARQQVVVRATQGLPAFHLLQESDLDVQSRPETPGSFGAIPEVVGRFTLQAIPAGEVLQAGQLSSLPAQPADLRLAALPVSPSSLALAKAGQPATLLLAPKEGLDANPGAGFQVESLVLAVDTSGETPSLVVAVHESDLQTLRDYLGVSQVFLISPKP